MDKIRVSKKFIPPGYKRNDPKAISEWMSKLPSNKDLEQSIINDKMYESIR